MSIESHRNIADEQLVGLLRSLQSRQQAAPQMCHDWIGNIRAGYDVILKAPKVKLGPQLAQRIVRQIEL